MIHIEFLSKQLMKDILWGILSDEMVLLLNWLTTIKIRANTNLKGSVGKGKEYVNEYWK